MELIKIRETGNHLAEIKLKFADTEKTYSFTYSNSDIFTVDFPEELRRILRLLPASITHSLTEKIENYLAGNADNFPFQIEVEKEILEMA